MCEPMTRWLTALTLIVTVAAGAPAWAQDTPEGDTPAAEAPATTDASAEPTPEGEPKTTADPALDTARLEVMLRPLTQEELATESAAWMALLRSKSQEIADRQLARMDAAAPAEGDAAKPAPKDSEALAKLRLEQSALIDRVQIVLDEWELKGGDPAAYEKYVTALSGVTIDVTDTDEMTALVKNWITSPEGGLKWAKAIGLAVATLLGFWILAKVLSKLTKKAMGRATKLSDLMRVFIETWVRRVVLIIGFVVVLGVLGINIGPLVAAIGALGLVIGLALQGTLSNFASGILILANRPFDVGDFINAGGTAGTVESVTLFYTVVKSPDNQRIIIPNNSVWGDTITNVTGNATRRVDLVFGIGYDDDMGKAASILEQCIAEHELTLDEPAPNVKVHTLGDSSVNLICRPWVKTSDYWAVYWDLTRKVKERFDAEGISIPFPQRDVHMYYETPPKTE